MFMCVCVDQRSTLGPSSVTFYLILFNFWDSVSHFTCDSLIQTPASEHQASLFSPLAIFQMTCGPQCRAFFLWVLGARLRSCLSDKLFAN